MNIFKHNKHVLKKSKNVFSHTNGKMLGQAILLNGFTQVKFNLGANKNPQEIFLQVLKRLGPAARLEPMIKSGRLTYICASIRPEASEYYALSFLNEASNVDRNSSLSKLILDVYQGNINPATTLLTKHNEQLDEARLNMSFKPKFKKKSNKALKKIRQLRAWRRQAYGNLFSRQGFYIRQILHQKKTNRRYEPFNITKTTSFIKAKKNNVKYHVRKFLQKRDLEEKLEKNKKSSLTATTKLINKTKKRINKKINKNKAKALVDELTYNMLEELSGLNSKEDFFRNFE